MSNLATIPIQEHYYRASQFTFEGFMTKITIINVKYSSTVSINYENYQLLRQNYFTFQGNRQCLKRGGLLVNLKFALRGFTLQ